MYFVCYSSFRFEKKSEVFLTKHPTLMDPADRHYTYVATSTIPNTGQGLFAMRDIPKVSSFGIATTSSK